MDTRELKNYIYNNDYIEQLLVSIGCHHIVYHSDKDYWSCANKDGDNKTAINVYNNEYLGCVNYTRSMTEHNRSNDIIDLVCYTLDLTFPEGLKFICDNVGIDYYYDFSEDIPESIKLMDMIKRMNTDGSLIEDTVPLKSIPEKILKYYLPDVNDLFLKDNIDYDTQQEFEIGYDCMSNRITIPIRSMIGDLVGVKGRIFKKKLNDDDLKYIYLEPCARSQIIYGLNKTYDYIQQKRYVYLFESEKAVMQLWSYGYKNAGATGGKKISQQQIDILVRLGVDLIFCFDQDVEEEEIKEIINRFPEGVPIYYMYDKDKILDKKESPSDNPYKWEQLLKNNVYKKEKKVGDAIAI